MHEELSKNLGDAMFLAEVVEADPSNVAAETLRRAESFVNWAKNLRGQIANGVQVVTFIPLSTIFKNAEELKAAFLAETSGDMGNNNVSLLTADRIRSDIEDIDGAEELKGYFRVMERLKKLPPLQYIDLES
jgi:hypothetical protein